MENMPGLSRVETLRARAETRGVVGCAGVRCTGRYTGHRNGAGWANGNRCSMLQSQFWPAMKPYLVKTIKRCTGKLRLRYYDICRFGWLEQKKPNRKVSSEQFEILQRNLSELAELQKAHKNIHVITHDKPLGLRVSTNEVARLAKTKYFGKIDAHEIFSPAFDAVILDCCDERSLVVPRHYRLNAETWECKPGSADHCYIDSDYVLQWWGDYDIRPENDGHVVETIVSPGRYVLVPD